MSERRSLLFIFAHPDDESFSVAGSACRYAEEGVQLTLVTATRGGKGKCGNPPACTAEELPRVREAELRAAAEIIGIKDVRVLDYKDRELASAPVEEMRSQLVRVLREARPQVVVTFDPHGANLHPDHVAISRFATDAISAAADPRWYREAGEAHSVSRLLWTTPRRFYELARMDNPGSEPGVDFLLDNRRWWKKKAEALRAHRSQNIQIDELFFNVADTERVLSIEAFRDAWQTAPKESPRMDLFEGL